MAEEEEDKGPLRDPVGEAGDTTVKPYLLDIFKPCSRPIQFSARSPLAYSNKTTIRKKTVITPATVLESHHMAAIRTATQT